ncbi:MAG: transglycosylase SLT domain-containing protein [Rickettsiales bacterium]|nr:transglycosylase SLT domain-containing protein [Rickettsiales bacterium]
MTIEITKHINFSLVEQGVTSLPSALKYWYKALCCFISNPSGVNDFIFFIVNWRFKLNQEGTNQYTTITPRIQKNQSSSNNAAQDKRRIIPLPVAADFKTDLRSLLSGLNIKITIFLALVYRHIIAQTHKKVSMFFTILVCFLYSPTGFANEECLAAIDKYEKLYNIPTGLLKAVSKIESEYNPFVLNDGLKTHRFKTKEEVLNRISYLIEIGKTNFDVGCMQINYRWHDKNFTSPEEMLDVTWNVHYAASLISGLYKDHGSWQAAIRHYHSYEPKFYKQYSKKIALAWLKEQ